MVFSEKTYSLLVVSSNQKFNKALSETIKPNLFWPLTYVKSVSEGRKLFFDKGFDLVLINAPLPDEFGESFATDISYKSESSVILLVATQAYDEIYYKILGSGVCLLEKPVTRANLNQTLELCISLRERMNILMKKQMSVEEKIEEIRIIDRAKWALIEHEHMTEPKAHRFLEKKSMDERTPKRIVAENIIRRYEEKNDRNTT